MEPLESGLRLRLRRVVKQMEAQHRHLRPIWEELCRAVSQGVVSEAADACGRYREALRAHFELERQMFFPALHGLHPERRPELDGLLEEHGELLEVLDAIGERCACAELEASRQGLEGLQASLTRHESREERLARLLAGS